MIYELFRGLILLSSYEARQAVYSFYAKLAQNVSQYES